MNFNRRTFAAGALALASPRFSVAQDATGFVTLKAEKSNATILGNGSAKTPVWRFMKEQPIAVVRARQGQEFKGRVINLLDQDIWLHWFGVRGPAVMMTLNVLPGENSAIDFVFTPPDAGTFWFGPMVHASEQRDMGLYGLLVVEEASPPFVFADVPLIFDDWMIDDNGRPKGKFGDLEAAIGEGRLGNWFTVNGAYKAKINVERSKAVRLRLLNAANARTMSILFKGADPLLMALDGQPMPLKALGQMPLQLAPGQRADLLVSAMPVELVVALSLFEDVVEVAYLEGQGPAGHQDFPDNFRLPANPLPVAGDVAAARHIPIAIEGGAKGGLKSAKVGEQELDMRGLLERGLAWAFNGVAGVGGPPLFEAKKGETLILEITNQTSFPQPIHIHGHVWQMLERDGQAIDLPNWADTAVVPGLAMVKLLFVADNIGLWPLQSLAAERVDAGLLAAFTVSPIA